MTRAAVLIAALVLGASASAGPAQNHVPVPGERYHAVTQQRREERERGRVA